MAGSMLINPLVALGRAARPALAVSIVVSLFLPAISAALLPHIEWIVIAVLAIAFLRADMSRLVSQWRRPDRLAVMLAVLIVVAPLILYAGLMLVGVDPGLVLLVVILAAAPPLGSSAHFAIYLKLDPEIALNLVIAGTFATPLIAPALLIGVLGLPIDIDPLAMMLRLGLAIGVAALIAETVRWSAGRGRIARWAPSLDGLAVVAMIVFLFAIMGGVPDRIAERPLEVLTLFVAAAVACFGLQLGFLLVAWIWGRARGTGLQPVAATVCLIAGNRNMGLFLAALPVGLAADITPFIALYQIPMYVTPLVMAPVFSYALRHAASTSR